MIHPERDLAAEVIRAAIEDVTEGAPLCASKHPPKRQRMTEEARRFLTATWGPWAISRQVWCDIAGIDPDVLRERIVGRTGVRA